MNVYNIVISWDKAGRTHVYNCSTKEKALESAFELLTKMRIETLEPILTTLKAKGKAFGHKDKKRFCIIITKNKVR